MNLKQKVKKQNLYREYLKTINGVLGLPQREIDILTILMEIDGSFVPKSEIDIKDITSTDNRKYIMAESRMLKGNLSKYLNTLRKKNFLVKTEAGGYEILPSLMPKVTDNIIKISFILEIENE
jgi:hypothetical protein